MVKKTEVKEGKVTVILGDELFTQLEGVCAQYKMKMSDVIREILTDALPNWAGGGHRAPDDAGHPRVHFGDTVWKAVQKCASAMGLAPTSLISLIVQENVLHYKKRVEGIQKDLSDFVEKE